MSQEKYIGMDVHQATVSAAVRDARGKLIMECLLETKAATIVEFIQGLQGTLSLTFEEGTSAAWLHDLLKPHVSRLVVCDPRKNALLKEGNKSDRIDARKLAELLRTNQLNPVYHGEHGVRTLKELGRSYLTLTKRCHAGDESDQSSVTLHPWRPAIAPASTLPRCFSALGARSRGLDGTLYGTTNKGGAYGGGHGLQNDSKRITNDTS